MVSLGRDERNADSGKTATERDLAEPRQDPVLDAAPQCTAAHENGVDPQRIGPCLVERGADESVVAETVADFEGDALDFAGREFSPDLRLSAPDRRVVELVGSLRELGDAGQVLGTGREEPHLESQARDEIGERQRRRAQRFSRCTLLVEVGAP